MEVVLSVGNDKPGNELALDSVALPQDLVIPYDGENSTLKQGDLDGIDIEAIRIPSEAPQTTATAVEQPSSEKKEDPSTSEEQPSSKKNDATASPDQPSSEKTDVPATTKEKPSSEKNDEPENPEDSPEWKEWAKARAKIPLKATVKWSNFEQFKNRYSPEDGLDIIEVLHGHPGLAAEIAREKIRRDSRRIIASRVDPGDESRWIQRVRIQSPVLMHFLSRFASTESTTLTWSIDRPRVFFRPFTLFYHTLPHMKRCFQMLQSTQAGDELYAHHYPQASDSYDLKSPISAKNPVFPAKDVGEAKNTEEDVCAIDMPSHSDLWDAVLGVPDPVNALQHVREYIGFVEKHILPMWEEAVAPTKLRARFYDLPMIFRPGDLLFVPKVVDKSVDKNKSGAMQVRQEIFKLCHVEPANINIEVGPADFRATGVEMSITVYHIDFDGSTYGPVCGDFAISGYNGEKDIRSLPIYPLRYEKDAERLKYELVERGKRFMPLVRDKHLYYDGWTLIHQTFGGSTPADQTAEHIEGDIIIDFKEGYQSTSDFSIEPVDLALQPPEPIWYDETDYFHIKHWNDSLRSKLLGETTEVIHDIELLDSQMYRSAIKRERFLKAFDAGEPWLKNYGSDLSGHLDENELALLPQRLVAYSFRARKFFSANIDCITKVPTPKNTFKDLKIDSAHKKIVKSLIRSHFQKQQVRRSTNAENLDQDFIRGKGAGLIILLHGVPGVGKTTTAEAVALSNRKPLYAITSGDLGSTPGTVEKALKETFRLAQLWDCVLLLDEADLFLSRRNVEDLERNSLVSVFLRVLEYYNGVLFLTTNRVGTIDEAFKSRIHLSLYYPPLSLKQTLEIFEVNLRRLQEIEAAKAAAQADSGQTDPIHQSDLEIVIDHRRIMRFAEDHFERHPPAQRWNGRQIRNAFQVAYSLAQSCMHDAGGSDDESADDTVDDGKTKATKFTLDDEQFRTVSKSIEKFDEYLKWTRGEDADRAKHFQVRNDEFRDDEGRVPRPPRIAGPQSRRQPDYGAGSRLGAPRYSPRPSLAGVSDVDMDDKGWTTDQTRSRNRRSVPQKGGSTMPMKSSMSSTHLSPASPNPRRDQDYDYTSQTVSNSEDCSDEDNMSHRGSVAGGAAKHHSHKYSHDERVRSHRY